MDNNTTQTKRVKVDMVQAKVSPELREKINAEMIRLGIRNESEYVRMMLQGTVSGITDLQEIKDLLNTIIEKVASLEDNMVEVSVRLKDMDFEVNVIRRDVKNLDCNPDKPISYESVRGKK